MDSSVIYKSLFIFLILITQVKSVEFNGKFFQGHFIVGKTDPKAKIIIDKKMLKFLMRDILFLALIEIESLI
jgi:hypothetical protein